MEERAQLTNKSLGLISQEKEAPQQKVFDSELATPKRFGILLFLAVFVVFGGWAALAPIDGAAVAPGTLIVRSYSKFVQHLEGGIIDEIYVENGEEVVQGQPILRLDSTQPKAQLDIVNSQLIAYTAQESRLIAERDGHSEIEYPSDFIALGNSAFEEQSAQEGIFRARRARIRGQIDVLEQRIEQLKTQGTGLEALRSSREELARSYQDELKDVGELLAQGFSDRTRFREIERNVSNYSGEVAELSANIAGVEMSIGETKLEILQTQTEFLNDVVAELSQVQTSLTDVTERVTALNDIVYRTTIRAPESGLVNGLQVHTIGAVIVPGMEIAEIVPQQEDLIVEAQVSLNDIDRVAINQDATIRFSSFGNAAVPTIFGEVINLSANSIVDDTSGLPFYLARVEVTPEGMTDLGDLVLLPGMPAEVFISTGDRTLLEYLFKPFSNALARSFRED